MSDERVLSALRSTKEKIEETNQQLKKMEIDSAVHHSTLQGIQKSTDEQGKTIADHDRRLTRLEQIHESSRHNFTVWIALAGLAAAIAVPLIIEAVK